MPRAIRDKLGNKDNSDKSKKDKDDFKKDSGNVKSEKVAALASADVDKFKIALARAKESGTNHSTSILGLADLATQKSEEPYKAWSMGLGGAGSLKKFGHSAFSSKIINAFIAGQFKLSDTWLADSAANMYIVNDIK
jgi:hypothetical protein